MTIILALIISYVIFYFPRFVTWNSFILDAKLFVFFIKIISKRTTWRFCFLLNILHFGWLIIIYCFTVSTIRKHLFFSIFFSVSYIANTIYFPFLDPCTCSTYQILIFIPLLLLLHLFQFLSSLNLLSFNLFSNLLNLLFNTGIESNLLYISIIGSSNNLSKSLNGRSSVII